MTLCSSFLEQWSRFWMQYVIKSHYKTRTCGRCYEKWSWGYSKWIKRQRRMLIWKMMTELDLNDDVSSFFPFFPSDFKSCTIAMLVTWMIYKHKISGAEKMEKKMKMKETNYENFDFSKSRQSYSLSFIKNDFPVFFFLFSIIRFHSRFFPCCCTSSGFVGFFIQLKFGTEWIITDPGLYCDWMQANGI